MSISRMYLRNKYYCASIVVDNDVKRILMFRSLRFQNLNLCFKCLQFIIYKYTLHQCTVKRVIIILKYIV